MFLFWLDINFDQSGLKFKVIQSPCWVHFREKPTWSTEPDVIDLVAGLGECLVCVTRSMADHRTLTKRNGQRKVLESLIERASTIVEGGSSRCPEKELAALVKNIKLKKDSIDALNEQILDAIAEEEIDDELKSSSELDLIVDTELEILTDCLKKLSLGKDENRAASISPEVSPNSSMSARSILVRRRVKLVVDTRIMSVRIEALSTVILGVVRAHPHARHLEHPALHEETKTAWERVPVSVGKTEFVYQN